MTRLWLVRHGPTHAKGMVGWTDLPADLSDTAAIARLAAHLPADAPVISSDLHRARATADAITGSRPRLAHDRDLRELHFGAWEMLRHDEIPDQAHARRFWDEPGDLAPPDGESWNRLQARVSGVIDRLVATRAPDVIIVCHFGVILSQLQRAQGGTAFQAFGHRIDPLSVTCLSLGPPAQVHAINHLP